MKIIRVTSSIIFLALSGCAPTGYQHGYAGYGGGYTVQRYYDYDSYGPSYYSPGSSFIYERSYVQPHFEHHNHHEHEHDQGFGRYQDRHRDWQAPMQPPTHQPRHFDGGHGDWSGRQDRGMDHTERKFAPSQRDPEPAPGWALQQQHRQPKSEQHWKTGQHQQDFPGQSRQDSGGDRGHVDGEHRGGRHGNGNHRGQGDGHYR